jgi:N-acyl-D-aspartate/D-glutamate deacylase
MLTHWVRDRGWGRLPLPRVVKALTRDPAMAIGLEGRAMIAVGLKADLNVTGRDALRWHKPGVFQDLPFGGLRLMQASAPFDTTLNGDRS